MPTHALISSSYAVSYRRGSMTLTAACACGVAVFGRDDAALVAEYAEHRFVAEAVALAAETGEAPDLDAAHRAAEAATARALAITGR